MTSIDSKRKKFEQLTHRNRTPFVIGLLIVVAFVVFITYQFTISNGELTATKSSFNIGKSVTYAQTTQQTEVVNSVESNQVSLSLDDVKANLFVRTVYITRTAKSCP